MASQFWPDAGVVLTGIAAAATALMAWQARRSADVSAAALEKATTELDLLGQQNQTMAAQYELSRRQSRRTIAPLLIPLPIVDCSPYFGTASSVGLRDEMSFKTDRVGIDPLRFGSMLWPDAGGKLWAFLCLKNVGNGPAFVSDRLRSRARDALGVHVADNGSIQYQLTSCDWEAQSEIVEPGGIAVFATVIPTVGLYIPPSIQPLENRVPASITVTYRDLARVQHEATFNAHLADQTKELRCFGVFHDGDDWSD